MTSILTLNFLQAQNSLFKHSFCLILFVTGSLGVCLEFVDILSSVSCYILLYFNGLSNKIWCLYLLILWFLTPASEKPLKSFFVTENFHNIAGRDIGTNLPLLLNAIVSELPPDRSTMLRIGMTNPPFILEHLKEIAKILCHPSVYSFLHVPVQSGSDSVLEVNLNTKFHICLSFPQLLSLCAW